MRRLEPQLIKQEGRNTRTVLAAPNAPYSPPRAYYFSVKHSKWQTSKVTFRLASLCLSGDRHAY